MHLSAQDDPIRKPQRPHDSYKSKSFFLWEIIFVDNPVRERITLYPVGLSLLLTSFWKARFNGESKEGSCIRTGSLSLHIS